MSVVDIITGNATLVVGVEDEPTGGVRVFVGARWRGRYFVAPVGEAENEVRRVWGAYSGLVTIALDEIPGPLLLENACARTWPG